MGEIWIKEAERLGDGSIGGDMDTPSLPGRVVWHTTESGQGNASFDAVGRYLMSIGAEPHFLYDPSTDRLAQYGPIDKSARALKNDGSTRTNRTGRVCVQIEVLGRAGSPFTRTWKPGPNFKALMRAIRSWGVPDVFPMGSLASQYGDPTAKRTRSTWLTKGGHYGHCNIPGNDHWDPGKIDVTALFAAAPVTSTPSTPKPSTPAKPSVSVAHLNAARAKDIPAKTGHTTYPTEVKVVEAALKAEGLLDAKYAGDGSWGTTTEAAYNAFRRKVGYTGSAATGAVGLESLKKLAARHNFTAKA
ncbi:peptidoglycan-binding protein LysM [Streptomyces canus]|uniref:peptidoglycan-binding protein LysM n=1 Tax=Streptomyces canus TaxID=58343 RepID=UPI003863420F|nr:peptidoglycan-binding protein LysM [Streptomyces canus]